MRGGHRLPKGDDIGTREELAEQVREMDPVLGLRKNLDDATDVRRANLRDKPFAQIDAVSLQHGIAGLFRLGIVDGHLVLLRRGWSTAAGVHADHGSVLSRAGECQLSARAACHAPGLLENDKVKSPSDYRNCHYMTRCCPDRSNTGF